MSRRVIQQVVLTHNEIYETFTRVLGILEYQKSKDNKTSFTKTEFMNTCNRYYGFPRLSSSSEVDKISNLFEKFINKYESQKIYGRPYYSFKLKPPAPSIFNQAIMILKLVNSQT
jgi:hypothetical protein